MLYWEFNIECQSIIDWEEKKNKKILLLRLRFSFLKVRLTISGSFPFVGLNLTLKKLLHVNFCMFNYKTNGWRSCYN